MSENDRVDVELELDDDLIQYLNVKARDEGITVDELVERILDEAMKKIGKTKEDFEPMTAEEWNNLAPAAGTAKAFEADDE